MIKLYLINIHNHIVIKASYDSTAHVHKFSSSIC